MSLNTWLEHRWVESHETSPREVSELLAAVQRDLDDCAIPALSADRRLGIAYSAALRCAVLALAAEGYRPGRERHHERAIESLRFTIGLEADVVRRLQAFRRKRNLMDYDRAGVASEHEATEMRELAVTLSDKVRAWLAERHAPFLDSGG